MSISVVVPVSLHWRWKKVKYCLDWLSKFCMGKVSASVKEKALTNLGYGSWEYYSFLSISFHLYASLANNLLLYFFNFLKLFLNFWVKNFPMRMQGVISCKSVPGEVVDFRRSFCQENEDKILPISSALWAAQGVSHGSCSSESVVTLSPPQLNLISKKKFGGQAVCQMACLGSLSSQSREQSISKHAVICCIWAVVFRMKQLAL